jgi:hypothetical protein
MAMVKSKLIFSVIAMLLMIDSSEALELPFSNGKNIPQHAFRKKLYGFVTRLDINQSGHVIIDTVFSNGERWGGDEGVGVIIVFKGADGKPIYAVPINSVVRGSEFRRHAREKNQNRQFDLPIEKIKLITSIDYKWEKFLTDEQFRLFMSQVYKDNLKPNNTAEFSIPLSRPWNNY